MQLLRSYRLLVTWQALRKKNYLPLMLVVQTLFSLGIVLGYPLLFPTLDRTSIYLIATGAPAISMVSVGLVALPQTIGEQKAEGSLAYMRSLPVPRLAYLVADLTVWMAIVIPGVVLGVLVGAWRFGLELQVSPLFADRLRQRHQTDRDHRNCGRSRGDQVYRRSVQGRE